MVQGLRLPTPSTGGLGSISGQGTRSHMPPLRVGMLRLKIPFVATKKDRSGYSFCPLLMPMSEAFSISFIL